MARSGVGRRRVVRPFEPLPCCCIGRGRPLPPPPVPVPPRPRRRCWAAVRRRWPAGITRPPHCRSPPAVRLTASPPLLPGQSVQAALSKLIKDHHRSPHDPIDQSPHRSDPSLTDWWTPATWRDRRSCRDRRRPSPECRRSPSKAGDPLAKLRWTPSPTWTRAIESRWLRPTIAPFPSGSVRFRRRGCLLAEGKMFLHRSVCGIKKRPMSSLTAFLSQASAQLSHRLEVS